ncbi:MAG TPA: hypothetical protein VIC35_06510 [Acidimicrobiia bacterium]
MAQSIGEQFADALSRKDAAELKALLQPGLDFRAMTPRKFWESDDPAVIVDDIMLGTWFDPTNEITSLAQVETGSVGSRNRVAYRLEVVNGDGVHHVEQQCYFEVENGKISWLRIMCAGYVPADAVPSG